MGAIGGGSSGRSGRRRSLDSEMPIVSFLERDRDVVRSSPGDRTGAVTTSDTVRDRAALRGELARRARCVRETGPAMMLSVADVVAYREIIRVVDSSMWMGVRMGESASSPRRERLHSAERRSER